MHNFCSILTYTGCVSVTVTDAQREYSKVVGIRSAGLL